MPGALAGRPSVRVFGVDKQSKQVVLGVTPLATPERWQQQGQGSLVYECPVKAPQTGQNPVS